MNECGRVVAHQIGVLVSKFRFGVNMALDAVSALIYFIKNNF
nr:MAG TPA: hypothetical protein [Microviridae sp.]